MTRSNRPDPVGGWHHVMNRGVDRQTIFFTDDDRMEFARFLGDACWRFGTEVHAYCLMTNHFHLLVRCPTGRLSDTMQLTCGLFAQSVNKRARRTGHLFGGRFTSRLVTSPTYIANALRYIHRNPLDIDGIERCDAYRWSSHRTYLGLRHSGPEWLRTDLLSEWFVDIDAYRAFVQHDDDPISDRFGSSPSNQPIDPATAVHTADFVIAERSVAVGRARITERRAIASSLVAGNDAATESVLEILGSSTPAGRRAALLRATLHLEQDPHVRSLASAARHLVSAPGADLRGAAA